MDEDRKPDDAGGASTPAPPPPDRSIFVIGVGASAGGLEALSALVRTVSLERAAMVVVQHLSPEHESMLTALLARVTNVAVLTAVDGTTVEAGHIYVIPPNADLSIAHGVLHVDARGRSSAARLPIDSFFRSLAADRGPLAVGVVLSGTGADGTVGLNSIKAAGGITFVQEPSSAKYEGMPQSALASGAADYCLTPEQIGRELTRLREAPLFGAQDLPFGSSDVEPQMATLFRRVYAAFGHDLSCYKRATIERRLARRMTICKIDRLEDYVAFVAANAAELRALYDDLLIGVTRFFRDFDPVEAFADRVFPRILAGKDELKPVRIWVPACSTGEEPYSVAIALLEYLDRAGTAPVRVQIFATDADADAIQRARQGLYPKSIEQDVSAERLERFFVAKHDGYQISRRVRDMVIFSVQNVLRDAPFSRIDLVSCRNLLIYLQPLAQRRVLSVLHFALVPNGLLVLGASETIGDAAELFALVDPKHRVFEKKQAAVMSLDPGLRAAPPEARGRLEHTPAVAPNLQTVADRKVLEVFGPPGAVIDADMKVVQFRGQLGALLDPTPGTASLDLARMIRAELRAEVRALLRQATTEKQVTRGEVRLHDDGAEKRVEITVVPLGDGEAPVGHSVVLFDTRTVPAVAGLSKETLTGADAHAQRIEDLERELARTRESLNSALDERATVNEELTAANEELQSANEELQSTNEELETAREEMQSTNEELSTVNEELQNRLSELSHSNDDLYNVLAGIDNAVVIVGIDLRIRRFTGAAERLLGLSEADVGSAVDVLAGFFGAVDLRGSARRVVDSLAAYEAEILGGNGRWYQLRITPYKTLAHRVQGAVITLADIDVRKRGADAVRDATSYATRFLSAIDHPLLIVDAKLRVVWANDAVYESLEVTPEELVGGLLPSLSAYGWDDPELGRLIDDALSRGRKFRNFPLASRRDGEMRAVKLAGTRVPQASGAPLLLLSLEPSDTTARKEDSHGPKA